MSKYTQFFKNAGATAEQALKVTIVTGGTAGAAYSVYDQYKVIDDCIRKGWDIEHKPIAGTGGFYRCVEPKRSSGPQS
ncbi:MAG: hypothetical protein HY939_01370 [Gammaproteobacteria bacterium]|nr:hypothetical protein [Gammaproteobacteria bacterium]